MRSHLPVASTKLNRAARDRGIVIDTRQLWQLCLEACHHLPAQCAIERASRPVNGIALRHPAPRCQSLASRGPLCVSFDSRRAVNGIALRHPAPRRQFPASRDLLCVSFDSRRGARRAENGIAFRHRVRRLRALRPRLLESRGLRCGASGNPPPSRQSRSLRETFLTHATRRARH